MPTLRQTSIGSSLGVTLVALAATAAVGQSRPEAAPAPPAFASSDVLLSMTGGWRGELEYRDYRSDERETLPASRRAELSSDGRFLIQELAFSDPGHVVTSHQIVAMDEDGGVSILMMMNGQLVREQFEIREARVDDLWTQWTVVLQGAGEDDRRPADIRLTHTMQGDTLTVRKDVRFHDGAGGWEFRNEARFQRERADAQRIVGTWSVDLRPAPGAAPYLAELRIDAVEQGRLRGSFYDVPIRDGFVNTGWGAVEFAFTTEDDSTPYYTSGVLRGDRLEGRTHAPGRGFLGVWHARRAGSAP